MRFSPYKTDAESSDSSTPISICQVPSSPPSMNRNAISRMKHKLKDSNKIKEFRIKLNNLNNVKKSRSLDKALDKSFDDEDDNELDLMSTEDKNDTNNKSEISASASKDNVNSVHKKIESFNDHLNSKLISIENENDFNMDNIDSGLTSSEDNVNCLVVNSKLKANVTTDKVPNHFKINKDQIENQIEDQLHPNKENDKNEEQDEKNELNLIKYSISELHKFCLNIINELQLTHSDLNELKRNLVQKDCLSLLLGNHLLNETNQKPVNLDHLVDTFTGQLFDTLILNFNNKNNTSNNEANAFATDSPNSSSNSSLNPIIDQSIAPDTSLNQPTSVHSTSIKTNQLNQLNQLNSILNRNQLSDFQSLNSHATKKSNAQANDQTKNGDFSFANNSIKELDESDRVYLSKQQFESLLSKNKQLGNRLIVSLKTIQRLNDELKESFENYDHLEIGFLYMKNKFRSILKIKKDEYDLMQEKINYLTSRLVEKERAANLKETTAE